MPAPTKEQIYNFHYVLAQLLADQKDSEKIEVTLTDEDGITEKKIFERGKTLCY